MMARLPARLGVLCAACAVARGSVLDQLYGGHAAGSMTPTVSQANLSATVKAWPGMDVAVFFYSPYGEAGTYSRQVLRLWDEVAAWHAAKGTKHLLIAKFSCEASQASRQLCFDVGVRQYPTITFFGYDRMSFGKKRRAANYQGLALAEALRDWTVVLHGLSRVQRLGDQILEFFGWRRSPADIELEELRRDNRLIATELERLMERNLVLDQKHNAADHGASVKNAGAATGPTPAAAATTQDENAAWDRLLAGLVQEEDAKAATRQQAA